MELPFVSIVVPVYQAQDTIEMCIESLLAQDYPKDKLEILLVDNNSTDDSANLIKKYPVKYLFEEKRGICFARNKGLNEAKGELTANIDSDCCADKNWISKLVTHFSDKEIGGVGGHLAPFQTNNIIEKFTIYRNILSQEAMFCEKKNSPSFFITANVMYRLDVLKKIGGLDNFFSIAGSDADLSWRVVDAGYKLILEPGAIVYHKHRTDVKRLFKQLFYYGIGTAAIFKKYKKKFGKRFWLHFYAYRNMMRGFCLAPFYLLFKKDKFEKFIPLLDGICNLGFVLGKIYGSIKYKVLVL